LRATPLRIGTAQDTVAEPSIPVHPATFHCTDSDSCSLSSDSPIATPHFRC
jgi:hypothetical protein